MDLERALTSGNYSAAVIAKARGLYLAGRVRQDPEYPDVFWVGSGTEAGREYRVQLYRHFASCSCKHGIHSGSDAHCAHPIAALTYVKEHGLDLWPEQPAQVVEILTEDSPQIRRFRAMTGTDNDADLPEEPF